MQVQQNFSLRPFNTFGVDAYAGSFAAFGSTVSLQELLSATPFSSTSPMILGGGSNVLFTTNPQAILKNEIKGITLTGEDEDHVYVQVGGGENWHGFVLYCIEKGWAGVENLSLIPGNVGAAPMQNIGAYGIEIKEVFHSLEAWHLRDNTQVIFSNADCQFGYRESIFKNKYKDQFAILRVTFRLNKIPHYNITYGAIEKELNTMGIADLSIRAVSDAVIRIRSSKLPDPKKIGNAGSFFKNPEVSTDQYTQLKAAFPELVAYPVSDRFKLAAGWLIEQCGWKGHREGDAGVHAKQALVLVNYGQATGGDIYQLSTKIMDSVWHKFAVKLEREVNIV